VGSCHRSEDASTPASAAINSGANASISPVFLAPHIEATRGVCGGHPCIRGGHPCIRGTRIMVTVVLDNLAAGKTADEIDANCLGLTLDEICAVVAFATEIPREHDGR
jgi:uncharacterized protein (DUF433 family)